MQRKLHRDAFSATSCHHLEIETMGSRGLEDKVSFVFKRGDETIIPGGNDELKLYDLAYFMTT